jgi:hypothetical protein
MWMRLTVDDGFVVRAVEAAMDGTPYSICGDVTPNFQRLVGERIGGGWRKRVRTVLGGVNGCTHLVELLGPLATVAFQTIVPYQRHRVKQALKDGEADTTGRRPWQINTCYGWSSENDVVRRYLPDHYTGPGSPAHEAGDPGGPTDA